MQPRLLSLWAIKNSLSSSIVMICRLHASWWAMSKSCWIFSVNSSLWICAADRCDLFISILFQVWKYSYSLMIECCSALVGMPAFFQNDWTISIVFFSYFAQLNKYQYANKKVCKTCKIDCNVAPVIVSAVLPIRNRVFFSLVADAIVKE